MTTGCSTPQHIGVHTLRVVRCGADLDLLTPHLITGIDDQGAHTWPYVDHHALLEVGLVMVLTQED